MATATRKAPMPVEERAKRFLASYSRYGGDRKYFSHKREVGELEQREIAERVLGEVLTPASHTGHYYLTCPGVQFHSNKSGRRDCRFTPGGVGSASRGASAPTLHCLHQSCSAVVEEKNREIRSAIGKASVVYQTDHGSTLKNAAVAVVCGFAIKAAAAQKILVEWGKTCTPVHTALACGEAVTYAEGYAAKHPHEVGSMLRRARRATPATPSQKSNASFASANDLGGKPMGEQARASGPIYLGAIGRLVREIKPHIEAYREDHGVDPIAILLGPDQPAKTPEKLLNLPVERMQAPGISVLGA